MIGFNDSNTMMAFLRQKKPQGGGLANVVRFAPSVGVAPGTTTLCLGCEKTGAATPVSAPVNGPTLSTGSCPPDETNQYMMERTGAGGGKAPTLPAVVGPAGKELDVYGSDVEMNGIHDKAWLGLSWLQLGLIAAGVVTAGAGLAYVARRR